ILNLASGGGMAIRFTSLTEQEWKNYLEEYNYNGPVKEFHHPDPAELVKEYLRRDAKGDFLRTDPWYITAKLHPIGSGWDQAYLISGYKTDYLHVDSAHASYEVSYDLIAWIRFNLDGPYLTFRPEKKMVRFELENTSWGWRIDRPAQPSHILPKVIIHRLSDEDQKELKLYLEQEQLTHLLE
ncbi:MAG: hypothetical protein JXR87_00610, partial [Candidatus Marinimicrobia bacterium]|nr:hypothetical protein [Candidatus Neomarinimicrobiota bacterium]